MSKNFHHMQSFVYTPEDSSCPQNQISQDSRRTSDDQGSSEHRRPSLDYLRNQGNYTPEQVAVHNDFLLSSVNGEQQIANPYSANNQQMHVPFFPDLQFRNQVPDGSVTNAESSSSLSSLDSGMYSDYSSALLEHGPSSFAALSTSDVGDKTTDVDKTDEVNDVSDDKSYAMVSARTALLSAAVKYNVTVGELKRRINAPECLHASLVNGILRKAKSKDGGDDFRNKMHSMGIELAAGRRKNLPNTAFTALTETEAVHIAKDYNELFRREFRSQEIAAHVREESQKMEKVPIDEERKRLNDVRSFFTDLQGVLSRVGEHPSEYSEKENREEIDEHVNHFSQVTHGFGNIAMNGFLETVVNMIDGSQSTLGTPLGQYQTEPPRGQRPQAQLSQQYVAPAMQQLPNPGFMGMEYGPFMGAPQYMMGQGGQPRL